MIVKTVLLVYDPLFCRALAAQNITRFVTAYASVPLKRTRSTKKNVPKPYPEFRNAKAQWPVGVMLDFRGSLAVKNPNGTHSHYANSIGFDRRKNSY